MCVCACVYKIVIERVYVGVTYVCVFVCARERWRVCVGVKYVCVCVCLPAWLCVCVACLCVCVLKPVLGTNALLSNALQ